MSKSAEVFNLMDNLLPRAEDVELAGPDELQRLYAGIGMPSLRAMELSGGCYLSRDQGSQSASWIG